MLRLLSAMPPKRQARAVTPPKKKAKKNGPAQTSIDAFFSSPSKATAANARQRDTSVISIADSDESHGGTPTPVAVQKRSYSTKPNGAAATTETKGKSKAAAPVIHDLEDDEEDLRAISPPYSSPPGINGSSSSVHRIPPVKAEPESEPSLRSVKEEADRPVHPMFAKSAPANGKTQDTSSRDEKPSISTSSEARTITSTTAEAVEPLDLDTDAFLFRPERVDVSKWPKGRLPYSVLVGVYVQVSSTKSRLFIVRVLTK